MAIKSMDELRDETAFLKRSFELALAELKERGMLAAKTDSGRRALGFMDIIAMEQNGGAFALLIWNCDATDCIDALSDAASPHDWLAAGNRLEIWCYGLNHHCTRWCGTAVAAGRVAFVEGHH